MKRLTWKQRWWHRRKLKKLVVVTKKRPKRPKDDEGQNERLGKRLLGLIDTGDLDGIIDRGKLELTLPKDFNLHEEFDKSMATISAIRQVCDQKQNGRSISLRYINFDKLRTISAPASLVLAAELYMWNKRIKNRARAHTANWDVDVRRQLSELGLFELLHISKPAGHATAVPGQGGPKRLIKFFVGGPRDVALAKELRIKIETLIDGAVKKHQLFEGLSEAITNVSHHAYPDSKDGKLWWMTASFNQITRRLKVVFYDRGITIPKSLPVSSKWEKARSVLASLGLDMKHEGNLIRAAMEMKRTSTEKAHRGYGLAQFQDFIKSHGYGYLSILSGRGCYKYRLEGQESFEVSKLKYNVPGTLIVWSVKL